MIDAIARASVRFSNYSGQILWNAATAAYSSRAMGDYIAQNPYTSIGAIVSDIRYYPIERKTNYSSIELVNMFPQLIDKPYSVSAIVVGNSASGRSHKTIEQGMRVSDSWNDIERTMRNHDEFIKKYPHMAKYDFVITFVTGTPRIVVTD